MGTGNKAKTVAVSLMFFLLLLFFPAISLATYPPPTPGDLNTSLTNGSGVPASGVLPGTNIVLSGSGFAPNTKYDVLWDGKVVVDPLADSSGNAQYTYSIPSGATAGLHTVGLQGTKQGGGTLYLSASLTVISNSSGISRTRSSSYPFTGGTLLLLLLAAGILLVFAGFGIKLLRRAR